eukprot:7071440-Prymnesium_polylepis.1
MAQPLKEYELVAARLYTVRRMPALTWCMPVLTWHVPTFMWQGPVHDKYHAALHGARAAPGSAARAAFEAVAHGNKYTTTLHSKTLQPAARESNRTLCTVARRTQF